MSAFGTLNEGMKRILQDWGALQSAARDGLSASQMWQTLKAVGTTEYYRQAGATWNDFQKIYGLARRNQVASDLFAAAEGTQSFSRRWTGLTPNARIYDALEAAPAMRMRVNITVMGADGEMRNLWTTVQTMVSTISTKDSITALATTEISLALSTVTKTSTRYVGTLVSVNSIALTLW